MHCSPYEWRQEQNSPSTFTAYAPAELGLGMPSPGWLLKPSRLCQLDSLLTCLWRATPDREQSFIYEYRARHLLDTSYLAKIHGFKDDSEANLGRLTKDISEQKTLHVVFLLNLPKSSCDETLQRLQSECLDHLDSKQAPEIYLTIVASCAAFSMSEKTANYTDLAAAALEQLSGSQYNWGIKQLVSTAAPQMCVTTSSPGASDLTLQPYIALTLQGLSSSSALSKSTAPPPVVPQAAIAGSSSKPPSAPHVNADTSAKDANPRPPKKSKLEDPVSPLTSHPSAVSEVRDHAQAVNAHVAGCE